MIGGGNVYPGIFPDFSCVEQLMTIINDILEVSKLEENKVQLEELPFSLPKVRKFMEISLIIVVNRRLIGSRLFRL